MNKSIKKIIFWVIICFCIFPSVVSAIDITHRTIWTRPQSDGGLGFGDTNYYTKGYSGNPRLTKYLGGWRLGSGDRVFCVEPGVQFKTNSTQSNYKETTNANDVDGTWDVSGDTEHLKKVLSCWSNNVESIMSTQAIVWEIISEERSDINATEILGGDYAPRQSNGTIYGNNSDVTTLYELIKDKGGNLFNEYKSVLRCASRFNLTPSFSYESDSSAKSSPKVLSNYDDETQTFTMTFKHSSNVEPNLLKYYTVSSGDSAVKVSKTDTGITVTTNKELKEKTDAVKITLKYTYKDNGTAELNNDGPLTFYVKNSYQSLAKGSRTKESYLYVYTGPKPTYQLRVQKKDEEGKAMSGVKFDVYSDADLKTKIGTTTITDNSGYAYLKEIKKVGKYYVQEADTPDGYKTNKKVMTITIKGENRTGTNSYATASEAFINEYMHLNLAKRTIDENGNEININDYAGTSCTGNYVGPKFTLKKDNKYVCVTEISAGKYKLASSCDDNKATNEIKTCSGKFDIAGIKSGCYDITETTAPDGFTLPANPTQKVCVTKGQSATATVMYNGVSGVIFNKIDENGHLIDGGKFALQRKINGVYKDMLLKHEEGAIYLYVENLKEDDEDATYILETTNGTINVKNLAPGEYRFVEKEAPEGYDAIKDKDSPAMFTISDKGIFGSDGKPVTDFYQVKLVNRKTKLEGSYDSAELIVTIITGRKVANYALIITGLVILLAVVIILRKKFKK